MHRQRGAAALEFALVVVAFTALLAGVTELGRYLYLWNTVQEVTRTAARTAAVRSFTSAPVDEIQREAVFHAGEGGTVSLPGGQQVTSAHVSIRYLNANWESAEPLPDSGYDNFAACITESRTDSCIKYVQAQVCQGGGDDCAPVEFESLFGVTIRIPVSTVTMPAESLGM